MRIEISELSLVALIGGTSSGKSTFAKKHFKETEVLSSDYFRGLVCDDENDQTISDAAFDSLYYIAGKRLDNMRLTVVDSTNIQQQSRKKIIDLAREQNVHPVAIVFNMPEKLCKERNAQRPDRQLPDRVIQRHCMELRRSLKNLKREGFRFVYILNSTEEVEEAEIVRTKLWNDKKELYGPFDIIGDVHGCYNELCALLKELGYIQNDDIYIHPEGRKPVFLGDLCDRGPKNMAVLKLVMKMVSVDAALCVPGNHDIKLLKKLNGQNVQLTHGLQETVDEIERETEKFKNEAVKFLDGLISHYTLDDGRLVVAHAGLKEKFHGRGSKIVRDFCLYGETTGETDEYGLPVRLNWASEYRGRATVVYGHIPAIEPQILNNTYCIDTGCVFGGKLTCLRYPEKEIVSIPAEKCYYEPQKPLVPIACDRDDMLCIEDVSGKLIISTELMQNITVKEDCSAAALEIISRFAADPHWLVYLPPTMSPSETSSLDNYLEYPTEAFDYYKKSDVEKVVCEKKHMGSRAVIVLAKDKNAAQKRFGVNDGKQGIIYTRTGRCFFDDNNIETELLQRLSRVMGERNFWEDFGTDFVVLDTELMPWSAKAQGLLENQYAPVGICGKMGLAASVEALEYACTRQNDAYEVAAYTSGQNVDLNAVLENYKQKADAVDGYINAYREYCWTVEGVNNIRIAPFHVLATEGAVHNDKDHIWHMETIKKYCTNTDDIFMATEYIIVDVNDEASVQNGIDWWKSLTQSGGEGMVVKPYSYIAKNNKGLLQPAVKCRGREYLRIIYGPEYTLQENMKRLKSRSLSRKRQLALREFSLGMESLKRFVSKEPLYRVHECVFGVLAFESEPVDPRL